MKQQILILTRLTWHSRSQVSAAKVLATRWMRQFAHTWTHFATWVPWARFIQVINGLKEFWVLVGLVLRRLDYSRTVSGLGPLGQVHPGTAMALFQMIVCTNRVVGSMCVEPSARCTAAAAVRHHVACCICRNSLLYQINLQLTPWPQGKRHTHYAGSYTLINTQEIAMMSGLAAAERLGADYPFPDDRLAALQFDMYLKVAHGFTARRRKPKSVQLNSIVPEKSD